MTAKIVELTEMDLFLHGEGTHYRAYQKLGAHPCERDGQSGVFFAVWAPSARQVSVAGDFNGWARDRDRLVPQGSSGIWAGFMAGAAVGSLYKFMIEGAHGELLEKSDPYGFAAELRPCTASVVVDLAYAWSDAGWMARRHEAGWPARPVSIYEMHPGSWQRVAEEGNRWLTYEEIADRLIPYVQECGFTHVELMPVAEHPFDGSWGYQVTGYFAVTSRFGTPAQFKRMVDRFHRAGIGVILDWVPGHFPKDAHGLARFDGTHLYEHADPRQGEHMDWGTLIFNYGRNEVRSFLLSNAMFWADEYHIDGLRVDAVASMLYLDYSRTEGEWIPNCYGGRENLEAIDFLKKFNEVLHGEYPGVITFAEESTAYPKVSAPVFDGGLGFDFKWNMGWMNDTLRYFSKEPVHRRFHQNDLTFSMMYAFTENFILPFSHDEVVHGKAAMLDKMPGDLWQKFANIRLLYAYMFAHPGKKLLFMGSEFGQWSEWNADQSLDWHLLQYEPHQKLKSLVAALNHMYVAVPALHRKDTSWEGFEWIDFTDADSSVISFIRRGDAPRELVAAVFNLTPVPRPGYRVGLPEPGHYRVMLNTDHEAYGGSHAGPQPGVVHDAHQLPWHGKPYSLQFDLPPLGALFLQPC